MATKVSKQTRYVFGAALASMAVGGVPAFVQRAHAAPIVNADFSFETSATLTYSGSTKPLSSSITGATIGALLAETGTGSAYGIHASSSTVYSSPSGNGSAHSFSSNNWAANDYYKFTVPTTGIQNILVSFDAVSSSTGPKVFNLLASADGTSFSTVGSYSIFGGAVAGTSSYLFSGGSSFTQYSNSFDLSGYTALNNDPSAVFEMVDTDTTTATGGTNRLDNVIISGSAVPEPAELSLLTVAAAALLRRRPTAGSNIE